MEIEEAALTPTPVYTLGNSGQVEHEYGAFGNDKRYLEALRQTTLEASFVDLPLFTDDMATPHHLAARASLSASKPAINVRRVLAKA